MVNLSSVSIDLGVVLHGYGFEHFSRVIRDTYGFHICFNDFQGFVLEAHNFFRTKLTKETMCVLTKGLLPYVELQIHLWRILFCVLRTRLG